MLRYVSAEVEFNAELSECFEIYWNLNNWLIALDDITSVQTKYDDDIHQDFTMTVKRASGEETVAGVRYAFRPERLELCQFTPPPGFRSMSGIWKFSSLGTKKTLVRAERKFSLLDTSTNVDWEQKITFLLERNLNAFKKLVEKTEGKS